jgi:hypothetical protein
VEWLHRRRCPRASIGRRRTSRVAAQAAELSIAVFALKSWTAPEVDSLIIAEFPPLFNEFHRKRFKLLWRSSRDYFRAKEFHRRCDGRVNTLTLTAEIERNVFGGVAPVEWELRQWNGKGGDENNCLKGDDSLRSFLFTLRNPHCVPPRKFALRAERKQYTIYCKSESGPLFCGCIVVRDNCNTNRDSSTRIGIRWSNRVYTNDTAFADFLTGAHEFAVKEIEVFEIAD